MSDSRPALLAARAAFNDALARRDLGAMGELLLPSYHVVTARSHQYSSREQSIGSWSTLFDRDRTATHGRTTESLEINEEWGMALEQGRWTATLMANDGPMKLSGVYAAKWQATTEGWRLQAEIFTPLSVVRG